MTTKLKAGNFNATYSADQVLKTSAAGALSWGEAAVSAGFHSFKIFTGDGTWTRPTDITKVLVTLIGGGGGGGGGQSGPNWWGGAAGGGGVMRCFLDVSSMTSATLVIGDSGTAGPAATGGGTGGSTTWTGVGGSALVLTATGGSGGGSGASVHGTGGAGGVPEVTTGSTAGDDLLLTGSKGTKGSAGGTVPGIPMLGYGFAPYDYADTVNRTPTGYGYGGWGGPQSTAGIAGGGGLITVLEFK